MTDLERRALLGDLRGTVLPCPFCGGDAKVKVQKVQYGLSGTIIRCTKCLAQLHSPDARAVCVPGGLKNVPIVNHREICIGRWNARPAPPIGRCGECDLWYEEQGICTAASDDDLGTYEYTEPDHFCGYFKQKDGEEDEL